MSDKKTKKFRPPMKTPMKRKIEDNSSQTSKQFRFEVKDKPKSIETIKPKDNKKMFVFDVANGKTSSVSSEKIKRMSKKFETFVDMETESGDEDNTRVVPDIKVLIIFINYLIN